MKIIIKYSLYTLHLLMVLFISCNQHDKKEEVKRAVVSRQFDNVHCSLQDKAGNLWFGTTGEGVFRYDGKSFSKLTDKDGLSSNNVWSILEDKSGKLWMGTGCGVSRFDGKTFTNFTEEDGLSDNDVWSMLEDKSGNLWFGTSEGVYRLNKNLNSEEVKFTPFLIYNVLNPIGLHLKFVSSILEDRAGNIWFASWNREGVCRYDGKSITSFKPNDDDMVHSILEDKLGNIWFGTRNNGACCYDGKTFINFKDIEIFSSSCVYSMAEDDAGNIWFCTELGNGDIGTVGGVWRYDRKSFTNFTTVDGVSNNSVFSVVEDKSGNLWFGTRNIGLCRYNAGLNDGVAQGKSFTDFSESLK